MKELTLNGAEHPDLNPFREYLIGEGFILAGCYQHRFKGSHTWLTGSTAKRFTYLTNHFRNLSKQPTTNKPMTAKDIKEIIKEGGSKALVARIDDELFKLRELLPRLCPDIKLPEDFDERFKDVKVYIKSIKTLKKALDKHLES